MRSTITKLDAIIPVVDVYLPQEDFEIVVTSNPQFATFLLQVQERGLLIGQGSPEGIVEAQQGVEYMDENGFSGSIKWIKQSADILGNRTQGWVAIG